MISKYEGSDTIVCAGHIYPSGHTHLHKSDPTEYKCSHNASVC